MLAPGSVDLKITTTKVWATRASSACLYFVRASHKQANTLYGAGASQPSLQLYLYHNLRLHRCKV